QPPLYYALCAAVAVAGRALTGADLGAPLTTPLQANPAWFEYTSSLAMLHPAADRWPLWPFVFRGLSILAGLGVVGLTYATARTLLPPPAPAAGPLIAAAFAALLPQANFIRASVSNETLAALIGAWIVLLLVQHLMRPYSRRRLVWLGVALGLGLLTKASTVALWPAVGAVLLIHRPVPWRPWLGDLVRLAAVAGVLAGPFYLWRWAVYGDPTAAAAWAEMLPPDSPWHLTDLFWLVDPFREALWQSFWGVFGWQNVPLPVGFYYAFLGVTLLAVGGGAYLVARRALSRAQQAACGVLVAVMLLLYLLVILFSLRLVAWQGREMFPALSSICVLFGVGLAGLALGRAAVRGGAALARGRRWLAARLAPAVALGLLGVNLFSIVYVVAPVLTPPPIAPPATRALALAAVVGALRMPVAVPPGGEHTFADVPPTHPAFAAIETGAHAGLIAGYTCGGPGEPCDAARRPYFRPDAPLVRGHLAKILVTARHWPLVTPAQSPFADMPPAAPLYPYITTAAAHGVLSGMPCRAPRWPCDAAAQPYFGPSLVVFPAELEASLVLARR
ncbi:MAG TPA: S-layer homology domain-containing protein, partial [Chloroflexia bacterium]